jgi:hypothetical protein
MCCIKVNDCALMTKPRYTSAIRHTVYSVQCAKQNRCVEFSVVVAPYTLGLLGVQCTGKRCQLCLLAGLQDMVRKIQAVGLCLGSFTAASP